jgi:hypothetical protein
MRVYSYNWATKEYAGDDEADASPMEPGMYLIPAYATTVEPPTLEPGQRAIWQEDHWVAESIPVTPAPATPPLDIFGALTIGDLFDVTGVQSN